MTTCLSDKNGGLDPWQLNSIVTRYPSVRSSRGPLEWDTNAPRRFGAWINVIGAPEDRLRQCYMTRPLGEKYYEFTMADGAIVPVSTQQLLDSLNDSSGDALSSFLCSTSASDPTGRTAMLGAIRPQHLGYSSATGSSRFAPSSPAKGAAVPSVAHMHPAASGSSFIGTLDPKQFGAERQDESLGAPST